MFEKLIDNLRFAATSPYALVAYLGLIAAWVYVAANDRRLTRITRALQDLPERDRLELLQREYSATPRAGSGAEQWIRSRKHFLMFLGFLATIAAMVVVAVTALTRGTVAAPDIARSDPTKASDPIKTAYLGSLVRLLVHAQAEFSGIRGPADANDANTWETSFYLDGVPCRRPLIRANATAVRYTCSILKDADFVEARRLFFLLLDFTTNALEGWEFTTESDLSDKEMRGWSFSGISKSEALAVSIGLTPHGSGSEIADLDFTLLSTPHPVAFPADYFDYFSTLRYRASLQTLLSHVEGSFIDIRGPAHREQTNVWESTFNLRGIPSHDALITTNSKGISYTCRIMEDAAFDQAKGFFELLVPVTTNAWSGWRFETESDLSDKGAMQWRLAGESNDGKAAASIELTRHGTARRSTDLEFRLTKPLGVH